MFKKICVGLIAAAMTSSSAYAANCSAYTYTLTNGTSADANQVMSNFNNILNCGNNNLAPIASPRFTGNVGIGTTNVNGALTVNPGGDHMLNVRGDPVSFGFPSGLLGPILQGVNSAQSSAEPITLAGPNINLMGTVGVSTTTPSLIFFVNGTAGGTSAYQVVSDARLKRNIQPLSGALGLVARLNPVSYNWRPANERSVGKTLALPTDERQIGFIAQEVEKVVPEAVAKPGKGPDATYGLKEESLIPVLVAAIKEQQAEIEQLRASLAALKPAAQH